MTDSFLIYAHRGSSAKYPENTMLAFKKALLAGASGIELDVQLTRDQEIVIFHDLRLTRIFNKPGKISDYTLQELKKWDAGKWKGKQYERIKISTLEEVLLFATKKRFRLNIELKNFFSMNNGLENKVIQLLNKYNLFDKVVISTFNPLSLQVIRELDHRIRVALLYFGHLERPWEYAIKYNCDFLHPPLSEVNQEMVQTCAQQNIKIFPYHVNSKEDITAMIQMGVNGIITSRPRTAASIVKGLNEK